MLIVHCTLHTRLLYEFCFCNCRPTIGLPGILSGIRHGKYRYSVKLEHLVCAQSLVIINYFNIFFLFMNQCVHIPTPMSPCTHHQPKPRVCRVRFKYAMMNISSLLILTLTNKLIDWLTVNVVYSSSRPLSVLQRCKWTMKTNGINGSRNRKCMQIFIFPTTLAVSNYLI